MAKDLAIDVGIPVDTDEFDTFVACVDNILTHGCGYGDEVTDRIVEKCHTSDLPIAKKVLRECRRISRNTSGIRPSKSKWWETYYNKKNGDVPRWPGRKPDRVKRPMSPMFDKRKRPMSPMFDKRKRPMSPMFDKRKRGQRNDYNDRRNGYNDRRNDYNDRRNYRNDGRNYRNDGRNDYNDGRNDYNDGRNSKYVNYREDSPCYERNSKKRKYR
jgi:hypothetical protein